MKDFFRIAFLNSTKKINLLRRASGEDFLLVVFYFFCGVANRRFHKSLVAVSRKCMESSILTGRNPVSFQVSVSFKQ